MAPPVTGREPAEQGGEAPSVAVPVDRVDAEEQPRLSERERRWADRMEEDGEEAECGEGPRAPALLQGDNFANAEGYRVTDAQATANCRREPHLLHLPRQRRGRSFVSGVSRRAPMRLALTTSSDGYR